MREAVRTLDLLSQRPRDDEEAALGVLYRPGFRASPRFERQDARRRCSPSPAPDWRQLRCPVRQPEKSLFLTPSELAQKEFLERKPRGDGED